MKNLFSTLIALCFCAATQAQTFQESIAAALEVHESSKSPKEQLRGLEQMEQVTKAYPEEWLPLFWAAYQCTQMSMLKDREDYPEQLDPSELLDRSETYLGKARGLVEADPNDTIQSDIYALQSLIYTFREGSASDSIQSNSYSTLKREAWHAALKLYPDNPTMMVFAATQLARSNDATFAELVGAAQLMKQANAQFEEAGERSMTTYFNKEWIPFWLPWIEGRLQKMVSE